MSVAIKTYLEKATLKKGADRLVRYLDDKGYKTAIVTSNDPQIAEALSKSNNIRHLFDAICSSNEVVKAKPEPDVYLHAARKLGVQPKDCLTFEDTVSGITSGKKAGMKVCAIFDTNSVSSDPTKKQLSDFYINDFDEVLDNTYEILHQVDTAQK
ncbi:HAD-superfamily hydrolase, subfamily IA, variant 3 containing protein [Trichomonas vaginalis G3]|uniref:HAD-superfamily hydrolase, subfamily IA, variant 3 containing protein n=1 Tax=Trichomonas vaginalis (strain ATCC PRA-98 / G3) TaxID=412133 RepID=A2EUY2_TRIV3|nr:pseudouridine 5'-phosphatase protein [Trichomonas vaginalis G3]EAY03505.1 HAD-superfamily hydrolase, subfamily IA, variant 3 containing protein [Trichomonas vaginalis G3]KAI5537464.1 pseudouridine 5'-phosphatase protein [Trichomonas vaginalis G3]|eukprot:XP_001315728.1 HAD-superfamily hydrolase, subfamily IA, variant 3 containing protein [Trichomonas vaginalis G3]